MPRVVRTSSATVDWNSSSRGKGLQHVHQRLAVVARRRHADVIHHALHLVAQQGNLPRTGAVGARREQADEAPLAGDPAALVERLDADVIEVRRAVHGGDRIGLGHDQQVDFAGLALQFARQYRRLRLRAALAGAQQAESGTRYRHQSIHRAGALEPVFAITEEGEVVVGEPVEELDRFLFFAARNRRDACVHFPARCRARAGEWPASP